MPSIEKYKRKASRNGPNEPRKQTQSEDRRQALYKSSAWMKLRKNQLFAVPCCEVHEAAGQLIDVTEGGHIDHIVPWDTQGGAPLDERNLMTLCVSCHGTKTMWERNGYLKAVTIGEDGQRLPAPGEKDRIITELAKII